jgi:BirA family biotin operon repressor/biotin-[acetyl-CoA-carboxylase] ligase
VIGLPRLHFRRTDSTSERARTLARAGAPHGTLVTADEQTAGRGRQGRPWVAPPGRALLMSVLLRGEVEELLPLAGAVAVCEACESVTGIETAIKWPNDVWLAGRKLAGVLVEAQPAARWAVVGIGVNVGLAREDFPPELREVATSLAAEGHRVDSEELLPHVLAALEARLGQPAQILLEAWRHRDALRGRPVAWHGGRGVAGGVDASGALLVETDAGRVALTAGEVHLESGRLTAPGD